MKAIWSNEEKTYIIRMTEKELGTAIVALTFAKYRTPTTSEFEKLQKEFLKLNNAPAANSTGIEKHIFGECPVDPCSDHPFTGPNAVMDFR